MAQPWEEFQNTDTSAEAGPWAEFQSPSDTPKAGVDVKRSLYRGAGAVAEGIGDAVGLIYNPVAAGLNLTGIPQALTGEEISPDLGGTLREATGAPEAENAMERLSDAAVSGVSGSGPVLGIARNIATKASSEVSRRVAKLIADEPVAEILGGAASGLAQQGVQEMGGGPLAQVAAGIAGGVGGGIAGGLLDARHMKSPFESMSLEGTTKAVSRLSAEDQLAYQQLMVDGSSQDILDFFKDRPGFAVNPVEVQNYVKARDAGDEVNTSVIYRTPAGDALEEALVNEANTFLSNRPDEGVVIDESFQATPEPTVEDVFPTQAPVDEAALEARLQTEAKAFRPSDTDFPELGVRSREPSTPVEGPTSVRSIQNRVDTITANWQNRPEFEVVNTVNDITDPQIRQTLLNEGADAKGFIGPDGRVRIIAENIQDAAEIPAVIFHEALGHHGMTQLFQERLDGLLTRFYDDSPEFRGRVDDWLASNPTAYADDPNQLARAADEVLAEMSEAGIITPTMIDRLKNEIKRLARQIGMKVNFSDREITTILGMAHDAVINGTPSPAANGFRYSRPYDDISENFSEDAIRSGNLTYEDTSNTKKYRQVYAEYSVPDREDPIKIGLLIDKETGKAKINIDTDKIDSASDYVGTVGIRNIRKGLSDLSKEFPEVTGFEGIRWTGAGGSKRISQSAKPVRMMRGDRKKSLSPEGMRTSSDIDDLLSFMAKEEDAGESVPVAWTQRMADDLGLTPSKYQKQQGLTESQLSARIRAAHNLLTTQMDDLQVLGDRAREEGTISPTLYAQIRQKLATVQAIYGKFDADTAEVGRALRILRETGESRRSSEAAMKYMREAEGQTVLSDPETLMRFMDNLAAIKATNGPESASKFVKLSAGKKWEDYASSLVFNSMLSSPVTWKVNFLSTGSNLASELVIKGIGSLIGQVGKGSGRDRVYGREFLARIQGPIDAFRNFDTWKNTFDALKTGEDKVGTPGKVRNDRLVMPGALTVLETPQRVMSASDEFWRNFAYASSLYGEAGRVAAEKGLRGQKFMDEVRNIVSAPGKEMIDKATKDTRRILFRDEPSNFAKTIVEKLSPRYEDTVDYRMVKGEDGKLKTRAVVKTPKDSQAVRSLKFLGRTVVPFVPTLDSIARTAVRNSGPFAFASQTIRQDLAAGGAARDSAIARISLSSAMMAYWAMLAAEGNITGVEDPDFKKQAVKGAVRPPLSIKIGDEWVSYRGYDPLSSQLAAVATAVDRREEGSPISYEDGQNLVIGMAAALKENSYAESLFNLLQLVEEGKDIIVEGSDPSYVLANFIGGHTSNVLTPNFVRWMNQEFIDPYSRDATGDDSAGDRIYGRTFSGSPSPVMNEIGLSGSQDFPQRYDVFGDPVLNPRQERFVNQDPVKDELYRLEDLSDTLVVGPVGPRAKVNGTMKRLTAEEYQAYQQLSGQWIKEDVRQEMETVEWQEMTDEEKIAVVRDIVKDARKDAREELFNPEGDENE